MTVEQFIRKYQPIMGDDNNITAIVDGLKVVNRFGYIITNGWQYETAK